MAKKNKSRKRKRSVVEQTKVEATTAGDGDAVEVIAAQQPCHKAADNDSQSRSPATDKTEDGSPSTPPKKRNKKKKKKSKKNATSSSVNTDSLQPNGIQQNDSLSAAETTAATERELTTPTNVIRICGLHVSKPIKLLASPVCYWSNIMLERQLFVCTGA